MSVVMSNNFLGEIGAPFAPDSRFSVVAGAAFFVPSRYGVGLRVNKGGQFILQQQPTIVPSVQKRVFSRIYRLSGQPGGSGGTILQTRQYPGGATPGHSAMITQAGRLRLVNTASGTVGESSTSLPYGVEFRVVFILDAGMFTATIYPDTQSTTPIETIGGAVTPIAFDVVRDGVFQANAFPDATFDIIWPVDDDSEDPGLRQYVYLVAEQAGGVVPAGVSVVVHHENLPAGEKQFSVDFGDVVKGPQSSPIFTHTYTSPGRKLMVPSVEVV